MMKMQSAAADHVLDLGPGAGVHGGEIVAQGTPAEVIRNPKSLTGQYLSGVKQHRDSCKARASPTPSACCKVEGARGNNLKNCHPQSAGRFDDLRHRRLRLRQINPDQRHALQPGRASPLRLERTPAAEHDQIHGLEHFDKVIAVDQSPIGRTPRSNPATYTGLFTPIRDLFAQTPSSRERGYEPGRFSFNVKGGRCETCQGDGVIKVEMHFLPDVYVPCDVCHGKRYNRETLDVQYKGKNIHEVLEMTVEDALRILRMPCRWWRASSTPCSMSASATSSLGQSATTLSGGEAQRVKLSLELSKRDTGRTLYILDEPTTGLHFADIALLLKVLNQLRDNGNTVVIIEHNLDVIKTADWLIDLGPEGGDGGGYIIATGTPEDVARVKGSYTGTYLAPLFKEKKKAA